MFVLADPNRTDLSSPVFRAGPAGREEAAVVFTSKAAAERYLSAQGSDATDVPAELQPVSLLRWVLNLDADGIEYLAVDPPPKSQDGSRPVVLNIHEYLVAVSEGLCQRLSSTERLTR